MHRNVNRVRNADFSRGIAAPAYWDCITKGAGAHWGRPVCKGTEKPSGVEIHSTGISSDACLKQAIACTPKQFYRVEATVTCELTAADESTGLMLTVQPLRDGRPAGRRLATPGLHRSSGPIAIRAVFQAPRGVRQVNVAIHLTNAVGSARVHHVRFINIMEPEAESHVLAIPPLPPAAPRTREVRFVCICSDRANTRPISGVLREFLGELRVRTGRPEEFANDEVNADAVLIPDAAPPPAVRSLKALMRLAGEKIVIISLPAFASLSRGALRVRRIEQPDDPIHARVVYFNHATEGFALHDAFEYAWRGKTPGSFVQHQLLTGTAQRSFCNRHGLITLLDSLCDTDATSGRPVALYKPFTHGELFVLDIEPTECVASTRGETILPVHLLLSIMGKTSSGIGQYAVPAQTEAELRTYIRDMADRFETCVVHDADAPVNEVKDQLVTLGDCNGGLGHLRSERPVILVRSGLVEGDAESVYGALAWFKQLVRAIPPFSTYVEALAARYQVAWVPCAGPWEVLEGWHITPGGATADVEIHTRITNIAALIDVVSRPIERARVVFARDGESYKHYSRWLPELTSAFNRGGCVRLTAPAGDSYCERAHLNWGLAAPQASVKIDATVFGGRAHCAVLEAGGEAIRIEVPGSSADFVANSIHRTGFAAGLVEHAVGLQFGLIALNRGRRPVRLDALPPIAPGRALVVPRDELPERTGATQAI